MRRDSSGYFVETVAGGEVGRALIPNPLPPIPPLDLGGELEMMEGNRAGYNGASVVESR